MSAQDWDQVSAYSGRSIPRPRIYPMDNQGLADDMRSHVSHFSGVTGKIGKPRYLDTQCVANIRYFHRILI